MPLVFNVFTGTFDYVGSGGGGGSPTGPAGGDLGGTYPNPSVEQIHGVPYTADPLAQYLLLAGRTGTTNNPIISLDADGIIAGSADASKGLLLVSSSGQTPRVRVSHTIFGQESMTIGYPQIGAVFPFAVSADLNLGEIATFGGALLNGGVGAATTIFGIGAHGTFAGGLSASGSVDNLLNMRGVACDADGNLTFSPSPAEIGFFVDGSPGSGFAPGQILFINMNRSGVQRNRLWLRHDGSIGIGDNVGHAEGRVHVRNVDPAMVVTVFQGGPSQTADLTRWEERVDTVVASPAASMGDMVLTLADTTGFTPSGTVYLVGQDQTLDTDLPLDYSANNTGTGELTLVNPIPVNAPLGNAVYQSTIVAHVDAAGDIFAPNLIPVVDKTTLLAQTADITTTAIPNTSTPGFYRVSAYSMTTVADVAADSLDVHLLWNDGAAHDEIIISYGLDTLGNISPATAPFTVRTTSGSVQYSTHSNNYATAQYDLFIVTEQLM